jgi:hypothetical protein
MRRVESMPSTPGMTTSIRTTSGSSSATGATDPDPSGSADHLDVRFALAESRESRHGRAAFVVVDQDSDHDVASGTRA